MPMEEEVRAAVGWVAGAREEAAMGVEERAAAGSEAAATVEVVREEVGWEAVATAEARRATDLGLRQPRSSRADTDAARACWCS